jgi:site-specific recombinase XerD
MCRFPEEPPALITAYAAGLRASEVAGLRVSGIDSARGLILILMARVGKIAM